MMLRKTSLACLAALLCAPLAYADNAAVLKPCESCHNLTGPAAQTLAEKHARPAPDLFYAGNKFRREWLVTWLQKPARSRPTGTYYVEHIKPGAKSDEIDAAGLSAHPALGAADAAAAADALMRKKAHDDLIAKEKLEPGSISRPMGEMVFDKFNGCMACHLIEPEYGGLSGPELYTAGARLQPEYIASIIRSPQAWQPKSTMPNKHVQDANIVKMVRYLDTLAKESANAKP